MAQSVERAGAERGLLLLPPYLVNFEDQGRPRRAYRSRLQGRPTSTSSSAPDTDNAMLNEDLARNSVRAFYQFDRMPRTASATSS